MKSYCIMLALRGANKKQIKDHLALFTHGAIGQWTVPKSTGRDYFDQMTAEVREERQDSRGHIKMLCVQKRRENHYLDCELMIDVAAIITLLLKVTQEGEKFATERMTNAGSTQESRISPTGAAVLKHRKHPKARLVSPPKKAILGCA